MQSSCFCGDLLQGRFVLFRGAVLLFCDVRPGACFSVCRLGVCGLSDLRRPVPFPRKLQYGPRFGRAERLDGVWQLLLAGVLNAYQDIDFIRMKLYEIRPPLARKYADTPRLSQYNTPKRYLSHLFYHS